MSSAADEAGARIEALLEEVKTSASAAVGARVEDLVREIVDLYGAGLARVVDLTEPAKRRVLEEDPLVGALLLLHGLHGADTRARIEEALARVQPYLSSHAGGVTLQAIDPDGAVHLRLEGSCTSCPSSSVTVNELLERALREAAPEIARVEVERTERATEGRGSLIELGRRVGGAR